MLTVALLLGVVVIIGAAYLVIVGKPARLEASAHTHAEPHESGGTVALREALLSRKLFREGTPADLRAAVMDVAVSNGVATLIAVSDGAVSLYLSSGGGILGGGGHASVAAAAARFREIMGDGALLPVATSWPLPTDGKAIFYVVTPTATRATAAFTPHELSQPEHPWHLAWTEAQNTLTALRIASPG